MYKSKKIFAHLPIKGNSERIPGKNFKNWNGRPLFTVVLDTLLSLDWLDAVVINTDVPEKVRSFAKNDSRLIIRERPVAICGDFVSMNRVISDDLSSIDADVHIMTHATNPLISAHTITSALHRYMEVVDLGVHDSLFSVNCFQSRFYRSNGQPINHDPRALLRTQDLDPVYEENSLLYVFTRDSFKLNDARIGKNPVTFTTPPHESVDIDDLWGWDLSIMMAQMQLRNPTARAGIE